MSKVTDDIHRKRISEERALTGLLAAMYQFSKSYIRCISTEEHSRSINLIFCDVPAIKHIVGI